jgi:hypothetical protein
MRRSRLQVYTLHFFTRFNSMAIFWIGGSSRGRLPVFWFCWDLLFFTMTCRILQPLVRLVWKISLALILVLSAQAGTCQLYIGVHGAPALQTIRIQEATITEGYRVAVLPQAGLRLRYDLGDQFGVRLGGSLLVKGANLLLQPDSTNDSVSGLASLQAQYICISVGGEYRKSLHPRLSLIGSLDLVVGKLQKTQLRIRDGNGSVSFADFFFQNYFALDIGLALQYQFPGGVGFRLSPTWEVQLNHAYQSDFFQTNFFGFAPRLELFIPLIQRKDNGKTTEG